MRCPFCGYIDQKVLDSRPARDGEAIRRRRECMGCGRRFTTFEEPERPRLFVIKRGGSRQEFSRDKVLTSMLVACRKRPVNLETLREASERVERDLFQEYEEEVPSNVIGHRVLQELRKVDTVAYVRFASVYFEFETVTNFEEIISSVQQGVAGEAVLR
ncbi:MAG: transcriptional regulator NrdR [Fimbriimonas sp.]|nr:transcriptional regulator NrdR [Fimbriimonas sp.]